VIAVFTDTPAGLEGRAGNELEAGLLRHGGVTLQECSFSSLLQETPKRDPKAAEIAAAIPGMLDRLAELPDDGLIVAAGSAVTHALLGSRPLSDVHGIPHWTEIAGRATCVVPTYAPGAGLANKGILAAFAFDLQQLRGFLTGSVKAWRPSEQPPHSEWLERAPGKDFGASGDWVALDTEGWADQPWGLSFSEDGLNGYVVGAKHTAVLSWLNRYLKDKTVVLHNGLHDVPVLSAMGVQISDYHDTQVLAYHDMIRTGSGVLEAESQNLGTLAYRECGIELGELASIPGVDFASRTIPYTDAVMEYAGADPVATWRLANIYSGRGLFHYQPYTIDMGQVQIVEQMIRTGLPFDSDLTMAYYVDVIEKLEGITATLRTKAGRMGNRDFNPGSHPQVRELLTRRIGLKIRKRTRGGLASTNEKALADHQGHAFVHDVQTFRELQKLKGTYIEPLLEALQ
jgi:hypothetical protein